MVCDCPTIDPDTGFASEDRCQLCCYDFNLVSLFDHMFIKKLANKNRVHIFCKKCQVNLVSEMRVSLQLLIFLMGISV
jgi:hypothetical protein